VREKKVVATDDIYPNAEPFERILSQQNSENEISETKKITATCEVRGRDKSSDLELIRGPTVLYTSHRIGNIPGPILSTKVNPPYRVNWSGGLGSGGSLSCESSDSLVVSLASNVFAPDIKSCNIGRISEGAVPQSAGSSGEGSTGSIDEQP
jgi:hypothetical protein